MMMMLMIVRGKGIRRMRILRIIRLITLANPNIPRINIVSLRTVIITRVRLRLNTILATRGRNHTALRNAASFAGRTPRHGSPATPRNAGGRLPHHTSSARRDTRLAAHARARAVREKGSDVPLNATPLLARAHVRKVRGRAAIAADGASARGQPSREESRKTGTSPASGPPGRGAASPAQITR